MSQNNNEQTGKASKKTLTAEQIRRRRRFRIVTLVVVLGLLLVALVAAGIIVGSVISIYNKAYEQQIPVVTRDGTYYADVMNPPNIIVEDITDSDTEEEPLTQEPAQPPAQPPSSEEETTAPPETEAPAKPPVIYTGPYASEYVGRVPIYKVEQKSDDVINVVVVGRDEEGYYGRADSAILVSYNKKTNNVKLISLLRDNYVPIEGHDWNKLGHALSYGGMGLYINTVNYVFGLDVVQYIVLDFDGIRAIVDLIGGIDIDITSEEAAYYNSLGYEAFKPGTNHLDGNLTLVHGRNRSLSGADFGRTERQRAIVIAMYKRLFSLGYGEAVDVVNEACEKYVKTNIPLSTVVSVMSKVFRSGGVSIDTGRVPFDGTWRYANVKPAGYTGYMSVTVIDIPENRKQLELLLYGG